MLMTVPVDYFEYYARTRRRHLGLGGLFPGFQAEGLLAAYGMGEEDYNDPRPLQVYGHCGILWKKEYLHSVQ